jgi:hypothetical protein
VVRFTHVQVVREREAVGRTLEALMRAGARAAGQRRSISSTR